MLGVLQVIAVAVAGLFALLVPAILVAMADGMRDVALSMLLVFTLGLFLSLLVLAAIAGFRRRQGRAQDFVALVATWLLLPLIASTGMYFLTGLSWVDSWFETASALTTSGASLLARENMPRAILFWRASLEWYGGFLALISVIYVLAPGGFGGLPAGDHRLMSGQAEGLMIDFRGFRRVLAQYVMVTGIIFAGLIVAGVNGPLAIMLAMVAIATGGFLPFEGALESHAGPLAQLVLSAGLAMGTVSVFWRERLLRSPRRFLSENPEAGLLLLAITLITLAYAVRLVAVSGGVLTMSNLGPVFSESLLVATSLVATSGIESRPGVIALYPDIMVLLVVLVGAGIYSTTGGLKIYRIGAMATHAIRELSLLIYPASVKNLRFGRHVVSDESMRAIWAYFILALMVIGTATLVFSLVATDFEAGASLAVALFSNAGPVYEALVPPAYATDPANEFWPALIALPWTAKLAGIATMTLGRLEVLVFFAVLNIRYWASR